MHIQNLVKFYQSVLKILNGNEILTSIKAITLLQICKGDKNPKLDKFGQILSIISQHIENLTSINGYISVTYLRKKTGNNPKLDLVNTNAHKIFGQIPSISSQTKFLYLSVAITLVINLRIFIGNNLKLDMAIPMHIQNLVKLYHLFPKILSETEILKEILRSVKGRNSVTNVRKMMCRDPNLNLVYINAYSNFG